MNRHDHPRAGGGGEIDPALLPDGLPAVMLDGIAERYADTGHGDDPAELAARLSELRAQVAAAATDSAGTSVGGWCTVGAEQAARQLAERGVDLVTARVMVADYLCDTSARVGVPAYGWGLDQGDLDALAVEHGLPTTLPPTAALAAAAHATADQDDQQMQTGPHVCSDDSRSDDGCSGDGCSDDGAVDETGWSR